VIKELFFNDPAVLPVCDGGELDVKLLVRRRDQLSVGTLHGPTHHTGKIRNGVRPFAPSNLNFIGMID